jgi:peptidoglycan L-alanyl-D-glutamate endopeptidase CwlK
MASREIKDCTLELQRAWSLASAEFASKHPALPQPFITCTYRSEQEQLELYAQGRTKSGKIVTQIASGGKHNILPAQAFDIAFKKDGKLDWSAHLFKKFADIVKRVSDDVQWGGDWKRFKDLPHFQV